ncbi:NACHT, LRR and PYD domains-containing protein 3-like [Lithobates pipiens]
MDQTSGEQVEDDLQKFRQKLSKYEMHELRMMYEYFRDDLVYIAQVLSTQSFLAELKSQTDLNAEHYESMKRDLGASEFSQRLVQDVLDKGRDAIIGFLECLYSLQTNHPNHNLLAVIGEIQHVEAQTMKYEILLDEYGYSLSPEITEIQGKHKQYLLDTTLTLMECKPPGTTLESQSFLISERYVNLVVVSTEKFRCRTQHELIEIGEKHESYLCKTQRGSERVSPKRLFRWCHHIKRVPNVIMISGVPGVGKTTLMQKFVCDWVNGKLYQRFSFVFFFKFRELNPLEEVSLEEMILHQYPYLSPHLENILTNPEQLLFIFDGLDECRHQMDFASSPPYANTKQKQDLGVILVNLLRQSLLKGCSVLLTSRPAKLASIGADIFQFVCEVMGFFHEERKMYFVQFFGNLDLSEKAFNHVRDNEALYTFCYIPSYCWIICTVLSMCFKVQPEQHPAVFLPNTVTQLFVAFICNILSNHTQESDYARNPLMPLGWLAEHGVMNQIIVFDQRLLESFNVKTSSHLFTSFMVESTQSSYVNFSFLHLTVQEFMAALVHYIDYDPEKLQKSLDNAKLFQDGRAEIFIRFLFGLSDSSTRALLKTFLKCSTEASKNAITWLYQQSPLVKKLAKDACERRTTLNIFNYLFESRNKALVLEILGQNMTFDFSKFNLTPLDCTVLAFILISCKETERLDLEKCYLETECWEKLSPGLYAVQTLRLMSNEMKDEDIPSIASALNHPDCKIQDLSLSMNLLTHAACKHLACKMTNNQSLKTLNLSYNNLNGPHFQDLIVALSRPTCKIETLLLYHTHLTHEDSQFLELLSGNPSLTSLSISYNNISDAGSKHIIALIENSSSLTNVRLSVNGFSQEVKKNFKDLKNKSDLNVKVSV